jgi:uncharacterized membrane protein YgdD (TMEM256/DUF423 family)
MERIFFIIGAISAFVAVAAGAFGAHSLKNSLSPEMLAIFETGVRYQMFHAVGLFVSAWALGRFPSTFASASGWLFVVGIILFSGSLYLLALTETRWLGAITPLGGLAFLGGWLSLAYAAWRG